MVTVRVCSKLTENRLFLQIKSGRILDISWAFLIKQLFAPLALISNAHSWNNCWISLQDILNKNYLQHENYLSSHNKIKSGSGRSGPATSFNMTAILDDWKVKNNNSLNVLN